MAAPTKRELVIDSHQHFWDLSRFDYYWMPPGPNVLKRSYLPADMQPLLRHNGVDETVLVQAHQSLAEAGFLQELADANPFIAGVVAWADLTAPDVGRVLERLARHPKVVGIRHIVEDERDDDWLLRPDAVRGLRELARTRLAYDVLVKPRHMKSVPRLAEQVPDLRMVVDHIAKPFIRERRTEPWATDMAAIASIPGVYCKVSGLVTEADHARWTVEDLKPYVHRVVDLFGYERLMFGSDWPVCLLAGSYTRVFRAALAAIGLVSADDRAKFLGRNARAFYRLP
jgi:L-fuconolactonase